MTHNLHALLARGEDAQYELERGRAREESAKAILEAARDGLDQAKARTQALVQALAEVHAEAEAAGYPRAKFRGLVEDRVAALIASGLVDPESDAPPPPPRSKAPRGTRVKADVSPAPAVQVPAPPLAAEEVGWAAMVDDSRDDSGGAQPHPVGDGLHDTDIAQAGHEEIGGADESMADELRREEAEASVAGAAEEMSATPQPPAPVVANRPSFLRPRTQPQSQ